MPKEVIRDPGIPGEPSSVSTVVGWTPDLQVQIGVLDDKSPFRWEQVGESTGGVFDGWHMTLSREQLNRLIRALRKARDSAYGADA